MLGMSLKLCGLKPQPNLIQNGIFFGAVVSLTTFGVGLDLIITRLIMIIPAVLYARLDDALHRMRYMLLKMTSFYL